MGLRGALKNLIPLRVKRKNISGDEKDVSNAGVTRDDRRNICLPERESVLQRRKK